MGYTTNFTGSFMLDRPLDAETKDLLVGIGTTRRMKRQGLDAKYGVDGEFYIAPGGNYGQANTPDVVDYNTPPSTQPGLWCQWIPNEDGTELTWDEGEKFYHYTEWITYLIDAILKPRGYVVNGEVEWQGEESDDFGKIIVTENVVEARQGRKVFD